MATDLDKLQGTWSITSLESDGQSVPSAAIAGAQISITKNTFISLGMGAAYEGRVEIDESAKPKAIDLVFTAGPEKGNRNPGIYKLAGHKWTLCLATRGEQRPAKFATGAASGFTLQTLERGNSVSRSQKSKPPVDAVEPSGSPTELEGEWAMISAVFNGAPMEESAVKWCKRLTRGDITSVVAGPQVFLKAKFELDTASTPGHIDYVNLEGPAKGKSQVGIFEFIEGVLKICMSAPGKGRPEAFCSKPGDGRSYTVWRRVVH